MNYLVQIQRLADGSEPKGIFAYNSYEEALQAFYNVCASSMADANIRSFVIEILDEFGNVRKAEVQHKPDPEPTE